MSNEIGSALSIPQSALQGIKDAEDRLENLKEKAKETADSVNNSFTKMATGTNQFIAALDTIIQRLSTIESSSSKMSSSLGNLGTEKATREVNNLGSSIENAAHAVDSMSNKRITLDFSNMNIAVLKEQIKEIDKALSNTKNPLSSNEQQLLVDRRTALKEELKEQELATQKRKMAEINAEKTVNKEVLKELEKGIQDRIKAMERQQKMIEAKAERFNSSYRGARSYSQSAKTLEENRKAIEYLNRAKMQLDTTDAHYQQRLQSLNRFIERHKQALREAGETAAQVKKQYSYLERYTMQLAQRMAVMFTINSVKGLVEQIAEVRGQFELSQRSLESILGNKAKADVIFQKTVNLALNSPFKIKDLVNYTRQLAAYRIENDKLFDTTKRLADVSAGLGVDMSRLILAYGQVKAAAYLRGSEVRQFTEAGVNMYGELQDYFKEVKGEAYTTGQIVDMISKKMVKFEDVEAIFQRMTDKGGMFYNMQEVQANTLYGMIQKMGDAFDKMLNEIGTGNEGILKGTVSAATEALKHWESIVNAVEIFIGLLVSLQMQAMLTGNSLKSVFSTSFGWSFNKYGAAFKSFGGALLSFGKAAKTLFSNIATSLPQLGIMVAIAGISKYIQICKEANEANMKANFEYAKTFAKINDLTGAYYELADAAKKANANTPSFDKGSNVADRRKKIQELISAASKDGLEIKIKVAEIDEKDLDKTFEKVRKEYSDFTELIKNATIEFNNGKDKLIGGYDDDMKNYIQAVSNLVVQNEKLDNAINAAKISTSGLTKESRKYYDEIKKGKLDGESQVTYMERMTKALIRFRDNIDESKVYKGNINNLDALLSGDDGLVHHTVNYNLARIKLEDMFKKTLGKIRDKYRNDPIKLAAAIDEEAAKNNWDNYVREEAYSWAQIPLQFDKDSIEEQADEIDKLLRDYFDSKNYSIKLSYDVVDDESWGKGFLEEEEHLKKLVSTAKKMSNLLRTSQVKDFAKNDKDIVALWDGAYFALSAIASANKGRIPISYVRERVNELLHQREGQLKYWGNSDDTSKNEERERKKREAERRRQQKQHEKEQRDLISERVSLLREMNEKYNELTKIFNDKEALAYTRNYFKEAAQNVGLKVDDIVPSSKEVVKRLRALASQYKEIGKRGDVLRVAADIEFNVQQEELEKLTEKVSKSVEEAFSQLSLYDKLKDAGVSDALIRRTFKDIVVSYKDLRKNIDESFNKYTESYFTEKYGEDMDKWSSVVKELYYKYRHNTKDAMSELFGEERVKQYEEAINRANEQERQANIDMFVKLTQDYKQNLTERLQLDKWYAEERTKILKYVDDEETRNLYLSNLDKQYAEKSDKNEWNEFKDSDMYISLFENLDNTSTRVLKAMREKLQSLRDSLKNLSPSELKEIVKQIEELDSKINTRNPFDGLGGDIKTYFSYMKKRKQLEEEYIISKKKEEKLSESLNYWNKIAIESEMELNELINEDNADNTKFDSTETFLAMSNKKKKSVQKELDVQKKVTDELYKQLKLGEKSGKNIEDKISGIKNKLNQISSIIKSVSSLGNALGLDMDTGNIEEGISDFADALETIKPGDYLSYVQAGLKAAEGIAKLFSSDDEINSKIKELNTQISILQRSYERLKKTMSDAFSMDELSATTDDMIDNLEKQNANLKRMIALEEDKKKSDSDQIREWRNTIQDNEDAIKEAKESLTEALGGFGSKSNYKSAAEAFSDAWLDAFKEGSNALDALNDKFDEYMDNLLKKQLSTRIAEKIFQPLFDAVDKAVAEDSDGGYVATKKELENIRLLWKERSEIFNDAAKDLLNSIGGTGDTSTSLSGLQKGIASLSESTGKELEGVLESIRYYLATQQADVRTIRDTLIAHLGNAVSNITQSDNSSPVLTELRQHTTLLTDIRDTLSSCVKTGHSQGRSGIKVFLNT